MSDEEINQIKSELETKTQQLNEKEGSSGEKGRQLQSELQTKTE
jgi:hypothetical protein